MTTLNDVINDNGDPLLAVIKTLEVGPNGVSIVLDLDHLSFTEKAVEVALAYCKERAVKRSYPKKDKLPEKHKRGYAFGDIILLKDNGYVSQPWYKHLKPGMWWTTKVTRFKLLHNAQYRNYTLQLFDDTNDDFPAGWIKDSDDLFPSHWFLDESGKLKNGVALNTLTAFKEPRYVFNLVLDKKNEKGNYKWETVAFNESLNIP